MKTRAQRLKDFEIRAKAPSEVYSLPGLGRYVTVNPMADETSVLKRLGMKASQCVKVDLYWQTRDDVFFVQVHGRTYSPERAPGFYVRKSASGYIDFLVVIREVLVTSKTVNQILEQLAASKVSVRSLRARLQPLE